MGAPMPRSQSLTRQKWNPQQQKWESAMNSSNTRPITRASSAAVYGRQLSIDRIRDQQIMDGYRPRIFYSREFPRSGAGRPPSPIYCPAAPSVPKSHPATRMCVDAATNTDELPLVTIDADVAIREAFRSGRLRPSVRRNRGENNSLDAKVLSKHDDQCSIVNSGEVPCDSDALLRSSSEGPSAGADVVTSSVQTKKEGSHSRLLSRGGESSSFRGRQSASSSSRRDSLSFRRETVSSSFRKEPKRRERKSTKSFQDGDLSSIASESARGSPCSIHYNTQTAQGVPWTSSPSSPDTGFGRSSVPFHWEEAPGKAKTIAAAAEMALARKVARDESLRKLNVSSPKISTDSQGSFRMEKVSPAKSRRASLEPHQPQQQQQPAAAEAAASSALLPPPSKRASQELALPRKDSISSQLIEDLKAAVVRKQAEDLSSKSKPEVDDDNRSVISDYCAGDAQIDLVAPAAAKFLNREDDVPTLTPVKSPLAAVPFKWEEAPGKPKESVSSPAREDPPTLSLPPRLLGGCHNPSKEQQAKILQNYSTNLMDMHWTSSGNPTPLSRSRDSTPSRRGISPTRREGTPSRRDRTPTKRDLTPGRREVTPTRREGTPNRTFYPTRVAPRSGPVPVAVMAAERVRENSGPLRSNTHPNYLNAPPKNVSQEFARVTQESALTVLAEDLNSDRSNRTINSSEGGYRKMSQELQIVPYGMPSPSAATSSSRGSERSQEPSRGSSAQECRELVKMPSITKTIDPLSPTSILCGPDLSQRTASNLSSAYAESSHSHHQDNNTSLGHTKTESMTSLESFVDESYPLPPPWNGGSNNEFVDSPFRDLGRDLGPIDLKPEEVEKVSRTMEGYKAVIRLCKKANKKWNKPRVVVVRKNSAEPDMWAPTLSTYFQKIEMGTSILSKVSQVFPERETKETRNINLSGPLSVPCSPLKYIPRAVEPSPMTPDRLHLRKPLGSMTPVHVITTCKSPHRVMATDECFSVISVGKIWNGTKARQAKWGRKMRKSSRLMAAIFATMKRSMVMKCGRQSLPPAPSSAVLIDRDVDVVSKEHIAQVRQEAIHTLSANHQLHRPL